MKISIVLFPLFFSWSAGFWGFSSTSENKKNSATAPTLPPTIIQTSQEKDCCFLNGVWVNQHGSMMRLNHTDDGRLEGKYGTAVETKAEASGGIKYLHGIVGTGTPTTFGFTVTFKGGKSTGAWSGQYHVCDGEETLLTTWTLTSLTSTGKCEDAWMATRVGQDKFVRSPGWKHTPPRDSSGKPVDKKCEENTSD